MDVRKFGKMLLIKKEDINKIGPIKDIGLEPWDNRLNVSYLKDKYKNKRLPIKSVILDQSIIAGIGNIYADEILYASGISPLKKAMNLNDKELDNIIINTRIILEKAIKMGGSTIHSYASVDGVTGLFQTELKVHTKAGFKCIKCGSIIEKIVVGGRGTYYCPNCQKIDE
jgi:formamidopyrimidine-DNA glycosylase